MASQTIYQGAIEEQIKLLVLDLGVEECYDVGEAFLFH